MSKQRIEQGLRSDVTNKSGRYRYLMALMNLLEKGKTEPQFLLSMVRAEYQPIFNGISLIVGSKGKAKPWVGHENDAANVTLALDRLTQSPLTEMDQVIREFPKLLPAACLLLEQGTDREINSALMLFTNWSRNPQVVDTLVTRGVFGRIVTLIESHPRDRHKAVYGMAVLANTIAISEREDCAQKVMASGAAKLAANFVRDNVDEEAILQAAKLLANTAAKDAQLGDEITKLIGSLGYVLPLTYRTNADLKTVAKSLLFLYPVGKILREGKEVKSTDLSEEDKSAFVRRLTSLDQAARAVGPNAPAPRLSSIVVQPEEKVNVVEDPNAPRKCSSVLCKNREVQRGDFSKCGRCLATVYCSADCQRRHWKVEGHKEHCNPAPKPKEPAAEPTQTAAEQPAKADGKSDTN